MPWVGVALDERAAQLPGEWAALVVPWSVGGVVGLLDGGADAAAVGDLLAVGAGPFADLGELVFVGVAAVDVVGECGRIRSGQDRLAAGMSGERSRSPLIVGCPSSKRQCRALRCSADALG